MGQFDFLADYVDGLCDEERNHSEYGYSLNSGKEAHEIDDQSSQFGIDLPEELREFYQVTYGALLSEYEILTVEEIANLIPELQATYESEWRESILPFAYVRGVGDVVAMDRDNINENGEMLIIDGFHELSPSEWGSICYGFRCWLESMVESGFRPYWLTDSG